MMLLKKSIHKVKNVIHKRLRNLKSLVSEGRNQNQLSRAPTSNTISSSKNSRKLQRMDHIMVDMSEESLISENEVVNTKESKSVASSTTKDWKVFNKNFLSNGEKSVGKTTKEERVKEEKKIAKERGCLLADKLKELKMVNTYNKDHVMDIEEALHYYSLITCPVYQDIVDRFVMDIYSEFLLPQPSASINNSMRRVHSIRL